MLAINQTALPLGTQVAKERKRHLAGTWEWWQGDGV